MIKQIIKNQTIENLSKVGVYSIHHSSRPGRFYIGSTVKNNADRISHMGFYKRFYDHLRILNLGKHHSKYLQNTVNKYGVAGIVFTILEICDTHSVQEIRMKEQDYITKMKPAYNCYDTVYPKGRVWTEAEKLKQSKKLIGKSLPQSVYDKNKKIVYQYKDGKLLKSFESIEQAALKTGIDRASISKVAAGTRKSAGKFTWSYIKNNPNEAKERGFSLNRL
jgi:hypothetical protein